MKPAISVREGAISSSTLLKRLRSGSRKNANGFSQWLGFGNRGEYSTHELGIRPGAYETEPGVDVTPPREPDRTATGSVGHPSAGAPVAAHLVGEPVHPHTGWAADATPRPVPRAPAQQLQPCRAARRYADGVVANRSAKTCRSVSVVRSPH